VSHDGEFLNPGVVMQVVGPNSYSVSTELSGCVITAMEPASFRNKLGFSDTQIATEIAFDDGAFQAQVALGHVEGEMYFLNRKVSALIDCGALRSTVMPFLGSRPSQGGTDTGAFTYPISSTETKGIRAENAYVVDETGYYRIECVSSFQTEYQQEGARLASTIAAISTNYNSNDFITGFAESGIPYFHEGASQSLSSMMIRVIDPATDQPVVNLGKNSTVFLEVVKSPSSMGSIGKK
jgi:hypothetical protein